MNQRVPVRKVEISRVHCAVHVLKDDVYRTGTRPWSPQYETLKEGIPKMFEVCRRKEWWLLGWGDPDAKYTGVTVSTNGSLNLDNVSGKNETPHKFRPLVSSESYTQSLCGDLYLTQRRSWVSDDLVYEGQNTFFHGLSYWIENSFTGLCRD